MTTKISKEATFVRPALQSKDTIKANQDTIRKDLLSIDARIHDNAVQCMLHAEEHGDTSLMRRLLVEVIDAKTGYRRQGLINWMRKHSPMELKGDIINLSGQDSTGAKRPFLIQKAIETPFWSDKDNAERVARPVFQDTLLAPIDRVVRDTLAAVENTVNGKPVDASKPFFDGLHTDTLTDFVMKVQELRKALPVDSTRDIRLAQQRIAKDTEFVESTLKDKRPEDTNVKSPVPAQVAA